MYYACGVKLLSLSSLKFTLINTPVEIRWGLKSSAIAQFNRTTCTRIYHHSIFLRDLVCYEYR